MTNPIRYISQSLTKRIGFGILVGMLVIFVVAMGWLFIHSREMVKQEAFARAERILENTGLHVATYLNEVEVATNSFYQTVQTNMNPDSLLSYSRRIVELNPNINSCSITTEPNYFPQYGRYFSAYSLRQGDSIVTVSEGEYEYYDKEWYKSPREAGKAVWVDPYNDLNEGTLSSSDMIASYSMPIYDRQGRFIGVISTDISLPLLSRIITAQKPYPNSYAIMLGRDGHYFVHPEEDRLFVTTIFDEVDPTLQPGLIALGHEMLAGNRGYLDVRAEGVIYSCFYAPIPQANWSVALVCVDTDIFVRYNRLTYIVVPLLIIGLLLVFIYCRRTLNRFIAPLQQLSLQARRIAEGHFGEHMLRTERGDVVGRLQNNFVAMQEALDDYVGKLQAVNAESERRNRELTEATRQADESMRQKTAFLQDMSHQIRTPLNIIMGFAQVLRDDFGSIPGGEVENITDTMQQNATSVNRMVNMLVAAAAVADNHEKAERNDVVNIRELVDNIASVFNNRPPRLIPLTIDSELPDDMTIRTHRDYLTKTLNELLYNAKKFTTEGSITLRLRLGARVVRFIVEDTGPGVAEEDRDRIFVRFQKLDDFGEGLGLGLSISLQFAQMLGGNLYLDKDYTGGSRFVLELPSNQGIL